MTTVRIVGPEVQVSSTPGNEESPVVTSLVGGDYVISWTALEADGSGSAVYAQRYTADGIAVGGATRINSTTANHQADPSIAALNDGGYVVTWSSNAPGQDGSGYGIYAQRYDAAGVAVGGEVRVNTTTASDQIYSSIAALNDGGYVVTWMSIQDGSDWGVYLQRYNAAGDAAGGELRVNTTTASYQSYPCVAALNDGGYIVTWMSNLQDGSGYGIYAQRYDAAGAAVDGEVHVSTAVANDQSYPSVAALSDGGFVVSWMSNLQDGSGYGIYAQRYDAFGACPSSNALGQSDACRSGGSGSFGIEV